MYMCVCDYRIDSMIMEAEKSQHLQSASERPRRAHDMSPSPRAGNDSCPSSNRPPNSFFFSFFALFGLSVDEAHPHWEGSLLRLV